MKKIVIIGGVAGGAGAAARLRRLDEEAGITVFEKGPYISFANCGLPYHIGGTIKDRECLLLIDPGTFKARYNVEVRIGTEVTKIDTKSRSVSATVLETGETIDEPYDKLIIATGARAFTPPIDGVDLPGVFALKTIPDMDAIIKWISGRDVKHATVVGGGFIGLETAENLKELGLEVTVVEMAPQVMTTMDADMAGLLHQSIQLHGIDLRLGCGLKKIAKPGDRLVVSAGDRPDMETDLVIMALGVRPESGLAKDAGIRLDDRGGIVVDETMLTSDPDVYAVGDVVSTLDPVTKQHRMVPLAGPASRQARVAADRICGRESIYKGTLGTAVCKVFDLTAASTGASSRLLKKLDIPFLTTIVHPFHHASYYPGACRLSLKILFSPKDGRLLGAQAVGGGGVEKRIDVLATAITAGMNVYDLEDLELSYAPPYGSPKDAINMAGFVGANILRGDHKVCTVDEVDSLKGDDTLILDTRRKPETVAGMMDGALHIPLDELRSRIDEIPENKKVIVYCQVGHRGYIAQRFLVQKGFECSNLLGGYRSYALSKPDVNSTIAARDCREGCTVLSKNEDKTIEAVAATSKNIGEAGQVELDARGLQCPGPLMKMQDKMDSLQAGQYLRVIASDPGFPADAAAWAKNSGHRLVTSKAEKGTYIAVIEKGEAGQPESGAQSPVAGPRKLTMVVFSNDLDKAIASMIIANGAAAMGMEASLFFTFWGLNILRKSPAPSVDKSVVERMFGAMMPCGADKLILSKMHMAGMGTAMMKQVMASKNVEPLPRLIESAIKSGVRFIACTMSMDVMGIKKEELIDGVEEGGVAAYLAVAGESRINLFI